ncbi:MAG: acyl-CoA dehydrogenase [Deltaproteobacteria bacterium]|nr:acyl-CoA dehydrogenase [Deltaproteobacteria bacterium]
MDFDLTDEQRMVQETARSFSEKEIKPLASRMDRESLYPGDLVRRLGEMGFMGMCVPPQFGGAGMDLISYVIAMEEIAKAWASLSVIMTVNNSLVCDPILRFGSERLKRKYLPRLTRGELLGCYALTEPGAGSDAGAIQTKAKRDGTDYVLNGTKLFITNGKHSHLALVYAVTDPSRGKKGISAFLVDKTAEGFGVTKLEDKLGLRASDTAELLFEDCRVPAENLLGAEGEGFTITMTTLDGGRIGIAAQAVGIAQACLEEASGYARQRWQFGRPIAEFQAVQWMMAEMAVETDAARLLTHRAAWLRHRGEKVTRQAAMAKLFASETANRAAYKALQIFGGYGYIKESAVERLFRDARITTLYEGTSEIQRLVIARRLMEQGGTAHGAQEKNL